MHSRQAFNKKRNDQDNTNYNAYRRPYRPSSCALISVENWVLARQYYGWSAHVKQDASSRCDTTRDFLDIVYLISFTRLRHRPFLRYLPIMKYNPWTPHHLQTEFVSPSSFSPQTGPILSAMASPASLRTRSLGSPNLSNEKNYMVCIMKWSRGENAVSSSPSSKNDNVRRYLGSILK